MADASNVADVAAQVGTIVVTVPTVGGLLYWAFRTWVKGVNTKLEQLASAVVEIDKKMAKDEGVHTGQTEIMWREINTGKHRLSELKASTDKLWMAVSKIIAIRRPSDQ